ncbi:MAG: hypothetical protein FJW35_06310 [Acidobacteria bacterium]|nr:hypothetical protein [Acidobacteriota bacterium]
MGTAPGRRASARAPVSILAILLASCSPAPRQVEQPAAQEARPLAPEPAPPAEYSPTGLRLSPNPETPEQSENIRRADEALRADPDNPERILEAARAREEVWRYNEAVDLYGRGIALAPGDYRFYLGRAHRNLRLRRFDIAMQDLARCAELDPLGFNTAYLRGLAYYLTGQFDFAAAEYGRCVDLSRRQPAAGQPPGDPRSCAMIAEDNQSRVAVTAWMYRALRRAGREKQASLLLETIPEGLALSGEFAKKYAGSIILPDDNSHYYETLLFYRGMRREEELLDPGKWGAQWSTVAYGVAVWHLVEGRRDRAVELLRRIVSEPFWARLGHVAAEMDLIRLGELR